MGEVIELGVPAGMTMLEMEAEKILTAAVSEGLGEAFVLGWKEDTGEFYCAGTTGDLGQLAAVLLRAQKFIMDSLPE